MLFVTYFFKKTSDWIHGVSDLSAKYNISTKTLAEKIITLNFALHFTSFLSIALSKILSGLKTIKKLRSCRYLIKTTLLFILFLTHSFWNFVHISRTYNQINHRNIRFAKVIIILIMTTQVLLFDLFSANDPHLNAL